MGRGRQGDLASSLVDDPGGHDPSGQIDPAIAAADRHLGGHGCSGRDRSEIAIRKACDHLVLAQLQGLADEGRARESQEQLDLARAQ